MEVRNTGGSWADEDAGWTEGDKWAYYFDVVKDVDALVKRGGKAAFIKSLDKHFNGGWFDCSNDWAFTGHNDLTNEVRPVSRQWDANLFSFI